jgi:hypothetical protein
MIAPDRTATASGSPTSFAATSVGAALSAKIRPGSLVVALAVSVAGVSLCPNAYAGTVPLATINVFAEGTGPTSIESLGSVTNSACTTGGEGGCESSFASANGTPALSSTTLPELSVSARGSTAGGVATANADGLGSIVVYYEIKGPEDQPVTLDISGSASTSASGADATADAYIEYGAGDLYTCSSTIAGSCGKTESASGALDDVKFSNEDTNVLEDMEVIATGDSTEGTGNFSARVDPTISIDPTWLASHPGYTFEYSSNLPGVAAIPEPSTWVMMLLGFAGLGFAGWRGSRKTVAFAE